MGPIQVRVSKIELNTGEIEVLVSSLYGTDEIGLPDMRELYNLRWGIEEGFKKLKPKMKLEHFGSRKPEGVYQEFEAHLFMMNLVSLIGNNAQEEVKEKCSGRKHKYQYNWQNAFRQVRNSMLELLNRKNIGKLLDRLTRLIASSVTAVKPDRNFARNPIRQNKTRLHQAYK